MGDELPYDRITTPRLAAQGGLQHGEGQCQSATLIVDGRYDLDLAYVMPEDHL
ncbi:MAG: hypothetical protein ACYCTF_13715 [Acidiferrobacter sp.]